MADRIHRSRLRRGGRIAIVTLGLAIAMLVSRSGALAPRDEPEVVVDRGRGAVPASYVGLHIHHASSAWPSLRFASWRFWDAHVTWPWLEPSRGTWQWDTLDGLLQIASEHQLEVLLPLGLSPTWASARPTEPSAYQRPGWAAEPADLDDWRRFVEAVVTRYAGKIRLYEIWNEPNLVPFFSGEVPAMVRLCREAYAIIKRVDPTARVVSPSATTTAGVPWLDRFLAAGGAGCFDIVGFHFYVGAEPPEAIVPLVAKVQEVMRSHGIADRPLWNTEAGWNVIRAHLAPGGKQPKRALAETDAAAFVARALVLARAAGVERFYYYSWDNDDTGLADDTGVARPPGRALAEVERWLVGAELHGCRRAPDATWTCGLSRCGRAQWIVWNPAGRVELAIPRGWRIASRRDLSGARRPVRRGAPMIEIGAAPQLLEAQ